MSSMSYCLFQNTLKDLSDAEEPLSRGTRNLEPEEIKARERLIRLCHRIAKDFPLEDLE